MARPTAKMPARARPGVPMSPRKRSAHDRAEVTESMEDYLECIFDLENTKGYACVSDVAEALRLNRASTSIMVKRLGKLGFLRYEPYRGFALTAEGRRVAEKIRKRHAMLSDLFQLMGLDHRDHLSDIEGLEHHLSERAFRRFAELAAHLRQHPFTHGVGPDRSSAPR
ncbi:MAG TPA: iron dependent repressor, metal binding and dimerization domain protein [Candidatus Methylacidiphilales bacterium]|jgi:Mn-dependent DtxR family transcriptional regulator|nr:iron dependent repressor, metal binding and dimerization domain protein [Candidatus Methylacidiphilales bacterium]